MFNRYGGGFFCYLLVFTVMAQEVFDEPSDRCSVVPCNMTCLFQPFPAIALLQRYQSQDGTVCLFGVSFPVQQGFNRPSGVRADLPPDIQKTFRCPPRVPAMGFRHV
ncbi:hypothetical protein BvCmsKSP026_00568 [Escherichia coli]|nr:hypothetical protein BvCmsKKP062_04986 [Escherichia coli]GDJ56756.1 hypothetical protein BvCmsKSP009_04222 [Escherichia coli]GDJ98313.1 hypothetical protein BvCmsKSP026_00568 [Escherichia coli]GDK59491.1 hypothetical protein BvCmsKSP001_01420 [Escherichia coli]GDL21356.1 hypothetical protein BvCmsKSP002_04413 [Escherichia coli]